VIGRLSQRAERTVSAAVLMRDAIRLARRWQTHAIRAAFSAALFSVVLGAMWFVSNVVQNFGNYDPSTFGKAGMWLFRAFAVVQVLVAGLVSPFTVASAVIEEREQGTIDLLLITRLDARRILAAKILARLLVLMTVVLGGLPVMAIVTSIGGVSVIQVVAVTVHALVACVVLGVLSAFFAVFTRYPLVATVASLGYAFLAFLFAPVLYTTLTGDWRGMASFSPLYGTMAQDLWSLLPALSYAPVVALGVALGARFYELKVSRAKLSQLFAPKNWGLPSLTWTAIAVAVGMLTVVPLAMAGSWVQTISGLATPGTSPSGVVPLAIAAIGGVSRFVIWAWCVGVLVLGTWLYLRLAADMVLLTDDLADPRRMRQGKAPPVEVWSNPVMWKSLHATHWNAVYPALGAWVLALIGVFQIGVWIAPGGLLTVGALNAAGGLVFATWLGASSIETERRTGSLEILLTSTMNGFSIVTGKLVGVLAPTAPMILLSVVLITLGGPHLHFAFIDSSTEISGFAMATLIGLAASMWVVGLWLFAAVASMTLALALPNPRSAYPVAVVSIALFLLTPPSIVAFASDVPWLAGSLRLLVPVLVAHPTLWEIGLSGAGIALATAVLFVTSCAKLRSWGLRHA